MLSVIIPARNAEATVTAPLRDLCALERTDIEILVIDDGSTDLTAATVRRIAAADPRVRLISKPNGGVSSARNAGLDAAKGDWITFVDADDRIDPTLLEKALQLTSSGADLIIAPMVIGTETTSLTPAMIDTPELRTAFLNRHITTPIVKMVWNKLYHRTLIDRLSFDTRIRYGEDTLFSLQAIARATAIQLVDIPWYRYAMPPAGTGKYTDMDIDTCIHSARRLLDAYKTSGATSPEFETRIFLDYRHCCQSRIYRRPRRWYADPFISRYYSRIRHRLPLLYRTVYTLNSLPPVYTLRAFLKKALS